MLESLPLLAPLALIAAAVLAFRDRDPRPMPSARHAERLAGFAVLIALASACLAALNGSGTGALIGFGGWGFSSRVDPLSVTMLLLVTFVGWVVVRFSATYLDGEARQGEFTGWLCSALAAVMLLVIAGTVYIGTDTSFTLFFVETWWWLYTIVVGAVVETPLFLWFARRWNIDLTNLDD